MERRWKLIGAATVGLLVATVPLGIAQLASQGDDAQVVEDPSAPPVKWESVGELTVPSHLRGSVQVDKLQELGTADGMSFFRGPAQAGWGGPGPAVSECDVLVQSNGEAQLSCSEPGKPSVGPNYMRAVLPGGRIEGAIFFSSGVRSVEIDGKAAVLTPGAVLPIVGRELAPGTKVVEVDVTGRRSTLVIGG
ncbi:MAG: hypothetical protein IT200_11095 [Thermoleophilia bacterium]|nr:hypothetical protein [Thermoleophilia bacterium]